MIRYFILSVATVLLIIAVETNGSPKSPRCESQGDPPTLCQKHFKWSCTDLLAELPAFASMYKKRPIEHNKHGMGVNHAFSLFFTLKKLRPTHVIESGVFRGQGTYLIRETLGPQVQIFSIDPRTQERVLTYKDQSPNTVYFMGKNFTDFASLPWKTLIPVLDDRINALVVLDDHMSSTNAGK